MAADTVPYYGPPITTEQFDDDADPDAMVKHVTDVFMRELDIDEKDARRAAESFVRSVVTLPVESVVVGLQGGELKVIHHKGSKR